MTTAPTPAPRAQNAPSLSTTALVLFGLWGLAVAQPVLDLLGQTAAFFVAHKAGRLEFILFALALSLVGPLLMASVVVGLRRIAPRAGHALEIALWTVLAGLVACQWTHAWAWPGPVVVALALVFGSFVACALTRWPTATTLARWLGMAAIVFPLLFLFTSPARTIVAEPADAETDSAPIVRLSNDVVVVVLDEFPLVSLLDPSQTIDAGRFPHFASLAATSTWYRNATTIAQSTAYAVPAILSGRNPPHKKVQQPVWVDYKVNLFTAVGRRANMHVVETLSRLCPEKLCSGSPHILPLSARMAALLSDAAAVYLHLVTPNRWQDRLPVVDDSWNNFWDAGTASVAANSRQKAWNQDVEQVFGHWLDEIADFPTPALHYVHLMTPHKPWDRLPDGSTYRTRERAPHGLVHETWRGTEWEVIQGQQRHLLQVGWTDTLIGRLRRELEDQGRWHGALVTVVSDHGSGFNAKDRRRNLTPKNFVEVVNVPLFIKFPGQTAGSVDDSNVETIDILPTLLAALDVPVPSAVRGVDLAGAERRREKGVHHSGRQGSGAGKPETFALDRLDARQGLVERNAARLGAGDWDSLYSIGSFGHLVGRPLAELEGADRPPVRPIVRLEHPQDLLDVDLKGHFLPVHLMGQLEEGEDTESRTLGIVVNGTLATVTESYRAKDEWRFTALIPKSALVAGDNAVEIVKITGQPASPKIRRLRRRGAPPGAQGEGS